VKKEGDNIFCVLLKDSIVVESVPGHAKDVLRGDVVYQTDARNRILCHFFFFLFSHKFGNQGRKYKFFFLI